MTDPQRVLQLCETTPLPERAGLPYGVRYVEHEIDDDAKFCVGCVFDDGDHAALQFPRALLEQGDEQLAAIADALRIYAARYLEAAAAKET